MSTRQKIRVATQGILFFILVFGIPFWFLTFIKRGNPIWLLSLFYRGTPCFFDPFFHIQSFVVYLGNAVFHLGSNEYITARFDILSGAIMVASLVGLLGITITLGRVFCSWVCPFGAFLDFTGWLRDFVGINKKPLPEVLDDRYIKYGLLLGFLISAFVLRREVFCDFCPAGGMFRVIGPFYLGVAWQILLPLTVLTMVLVLTVMFDTRGWCKFFCPLGAFVSITSRLTPMGRMKLPAHACIECRKCEKVCPMDIDIVAETRYKLINSKEVKKVLAAEGDPDMLQMPKKFDKLPEPVQDALNKGKLKYTVPAGECIRCFKCLDTCPIHTQLVKKAKEEKEAAKNPPMGEPADEKEGAKT